MTVVYTLYTSSFLISVRCIYRVVEYFERVHKHHLPDRGLNPCRPYPLYLCVGLANPLQVFEATLMYLKVLNLNLFHSGRFLPKNDKIYLDAQGQEVESTGDRSGWDDDRPWYIALFDPSTSRASFVGTRRVKPPSRVL